MRVLDFSTAVTGGLFFSPTIHDFFSTIRYEAATPTLATGSLSIGSRKPIEQSTAIWHRSPKPAWAKSAEWAAGRSATHHGARVVDVSSPGSPSPWRWPAIDGGRHQPAA